MAVLALVVAATQLSQRADPLSAAETSPSPTPVRIQPAIVPTTGSSLPSASVSPTGPPYPTIERLPQAASAPVDVVVGAELRTTDGARVNLSWAGQYPYLTTAPGGWLVHGDSTLWFLDRSGEAQPLLWQIDWAMVGRNGRVAWMRGTRVGAARVQNGVLVGRREVDAKGYFPMWIIGDDVVMGLPNQFGDGPPTAYDLWRPRLGAFEPDPIEPAGTPFGVNHAGTALLGVDLRDDDPGCLVEFNPRTFAVIRRACVLSPVGIGSAEGMGSYAISPDGHWLLMSFINSDIDAPVLRIDLTRVFRGAAAVDRLTWRGEFGVDGRAWLDDTTMVIGWAGALRQIDVNKPNVIVEIPLADVPTNVDGGGLMTVLPVGTAP